MAVAKFSPLAALVLSFASAAATMASEITGARFLGAVDISTGTIHEGTVVGGLSGLARIGDGKFFALSDDTEAPRVYRPKIDLTDGGLEAGDVTLAGVGFLREPDGRPFRKRRLDPEGIGIGPDGRIYVADEGLGFFGTPSQVRIFDSELQFSGALAPPAETMPDGGGDVPSTRGIRPNLGFESVAISPDGRWLATATEQALLQDGPKANASGGSNARIVTYDLETGRQGPEFVYPVGPVPTLIDVARLPQTSGLVELLALDNAGRYLALERTFSVFSGFGARLFQVDSAGATDVRGVAALPTHFRPVEKVELLDLSGLGIRLDNLEGMAFGDWLDVDTRVLILVSDNNFRDLQTTQILAFALSFAPHRLAILAGHSLVAGGAPVE